jgi:ATP-dependent Lon protease
MSATQTSPRSLPPNPSAEYLRKEAKRLARDEAMQLAAAQRRLAHEYGYRSWAELMTAVQKIASGREAGTGANPSQPVGSTPVSDSGANVFPLLPLRGLVAFPHVSYPIFVGRPMSIKAVQYAKDREVPIFLAAQKDPKSTDPSGSEMYQVGSLGRVIEAMRLPDGSIKTIIEANGRARVNRFIFDTDFSQAEVEEIEETATSDPRIEDLVPLVISAFMRRRVKTLGQKKELERIRLRAGLELVKVRGAVERVELRLVEPLNERLSRPVDELPISLRALKGLQSADIKRVGELVQRTEQDMLKIKNFGRKALDEIKEMLAGMGLTLGMPEAWAAARTDAGSASMLADRIASEMPMELAWKQALLELLNPADRLEKLLAYLNVLS